MSAGAHIASFNLGRLVAPCDDPAVAGFVDNVERVNALAALSPGFVWRADDTRLAAAFAAGVLPADDRLAATLAVWESVEALRRFVHRTLHGRFLARRALWFEPAEGPSHVMWPVPRDHRPGVAEAVNRLERLARHGAGPDAFDWTYAEQPSAPAA